MATVTAMLRPDSALATCTLSSMWGHSQRPVHAGTTARHQLEAFCQDGWNNHYPPQDVLITIPSAPGTGRETDKRQPLPGGLCPGRRQVRCLRPCPHTLPAHPLPGSRLWGKHSFPLPVASRRPPLWGLRPWFRKEPRPHMAHGSPLWEPYVVGAHLPKLVADTTGRKLGHGHAGTLPPQTPGPKVPEACSLVDPAVMWINKHPFPCAPELLEGWVSTTCMERVRTHQAPFPALRPSSA